MYAFDSSTISLCLSVFWWTKLHHGKGGVKLHELYDLKTDILAFSIINASSSSARNSKFVTMDENHQKMINIRAIDVIRLLIKDKKKICIYSLTLGIIGVILSFGTPKVYKSTVTLAPEESGQGFSANTSSLASMIGINLKIGQTGDAIYPEIYPDLMGST